MSQTFDRWQKREPGNDVVAREKLTPGRSVGGIQRTWFYTEICCVSVTEYQSTFHLRPHRSFRLITLFGCRQL